MLIALAIVDAGLRVKEVFVIGLRKKKILMGTSLLGLPVKVQSSQGPRASMVRDPNLPDSDEATRLRP